MLGANVKYIIECKFFPLNMYNLKGILCGAKSYL